MNDLLYKLEFAPRKPIQKSIAPAQALQSIRGLSVSDSELLMVWANQLQANHVRTNTDAEK